MMRNSPGLTLSIVEDKILRYLNLIVFVQWQDGKRSVQEIRRLHEAA
jgi:hypothetical protein